MAMSNFNVRLITSICLGLVFLLFILVRAFVPGFGIYFFDVALLILICLTTWEICNAKQLYKRGANAYVAFVVYGLLYMFYIIGSAVVAEPLPWWLQIIISLIIVGIFVLFIGLSNMLDKNFAKECRLQKKDLNHEAWGGAWDLLQMIIYPGVLFMCLVLLNHLTTNDMGLFGLLLLIFTSCFADIFAYSVGLLLGKGTAKMAPKLSPKKTWVGFIGGLFGGVLGSLIVVWIISGNETIVNHLVDKIGDPLLVQLLFAVVGLVAAVVTAMGDLYASYIKRKANIKDFGKTLPGHGGFMDRLDGIIMNAPFILLIMGII